MCLDVLGYAPLHGVHTHCPYSNTVVKYTDINHHKTSDTECALLSQLPPTYSLIHSLHHRTTLHALHAGANRCTTVGNARGNACKSHRRLFKPSAYEAVMTLTLKALWLLWSLLVFYKGMFEKFQWAEQHQDWLQLATQLKKSPAMLLTKL